MLLPLSFRSRAFALLVLAAGGVCLLFARGANASGVVTDCSDDSDFAAKVAVGGDISFNCGTATIITSAALTIASDTTVDGGGVITISGGNAHLVFFVNAGATLTLKDIVVTNGYNSLGDGGAIYNNGHLVLDGTTVQNSQTKPASSGGAIVTYGPLEATDSVIQNNTTGNGGGIYARFAPAPVTLTDTVISGNTTIGSGIGGGILLWDGATLDVNGGDISGNQASSGGGIYNSFANSSITLHGGSIRNNTAVENPSGDNNGGGIYASSGPLAITDVTITGNMAGNLGGGADSGGGIYTSGNTTTVTGTTIANNSSVNGGGAYNDDSDVTYTNVTFSENSAYSDGGLKTFKNTARLNNVTFSGNSAGHGAAVTTYLPTYVGLTNVIVASSGGPNCDFGKPLDVSLFNLSTDGTCSFGAGRDNIADMKLGPLQDNGGPTLTHALLPGSPAIDNGTSTGCPATDQRGAHRPAGAACDVGAVESGSNPPTATPTASPTHTPTHTPSPAATATPTPSASPTPPSHHKQGDLDCNGSVNGTDALRPVLFAAGVPMSQPGACPALDSRTPAFADVNCDDQIGPADAIAIEEFSAGLPVLPAPPAGCTPIGQLLP